jgi:hypothetical protein
MENSLCILQKVLDIVQQWCDKTDLSVNLNKTEIITSYQEGGCVRLKDPNFFRKTVQLSTEIKYLGLISMD